VAKCKNEQIAKGVSEMRIDNICSDKTLSSEDAKDSSESCSVESYNYLNQNK
jgi:hypothetical protein